MTGALWIRNRQPVRAVNTRLLRQIALALLAEHFRGGQFEICVHLIAAPEMTALNKRFLRHQGSTDVITFDYAEMAGQASRSARDRRDARHVLAGEIFICLDDAVAQARQFRTTWQKELTRYVIHGLLHLSGHDDRRPVTRRKMKREENLFLREMSRQFELARLMKRKPGRLVAAS